MDFSFADYIIYKYSVFLDPFSITEIKTECLCYPVSYASKETLEGLNDLCSSKDAEDDIIVRQSLEKDMKYLNKSFPVESIADGAAHIWNTRNSQALVQLIGMPKIGKTSLLRKIALLAAYTLKSDPKALVPLLINCETLANHPISCKMEMIETCFSQFEEFEAYLREKFFSGKLVLLLDEVEKVQCLGYRLVEWISALRTFVNIPLCVIASRYSGYIKTVDSKVLIMDVYPIKLQVFMSQTMLSEFQFERFIERITANSDCFSEFASTPYMFSLLLELFRWGIVGIEEHILRGKVYQLALKHLLRDFDQCKYWQALEVLAADLLLKDGKLFNVFDIKNLEIEDVWMDLKNTELFLVHEDKAKVATPRTSEVEVLTESFQEFEIGDIKETPVANFINNKDTTPKWVANSKDSYINYQIARNCLEKDIFNSFYSESFRFVHLRFTELLAAQYYMNQVEDSLLHTTSNFLMESSAFQKAFTMCFPNNYLFCRRYREVLLFFASLCSENIFENFVKFLLNKNTAEHLYIIMIVLKERGHHPNHRPLLNKFKQDRLEIIKKNYSKGFASASAIIRSIVTQEALEFGLSESDLSQIVYKNIDSVLKCPSWLYLKQVHQYTKNSNIKMMKSVFLRVLEVSLQIINNGQRPATNKVLVHKILMMIFISAFDHSDLPVLSQNCEDPDMRISEEATVRISFDKLKIPRSELGLIEKIGSSQKMVMVIEELIQGSPGVDVNLCVRILLLFGVSVSKIHMAIACRFESFADPYEKKEILKVLKLLGFVTQHTIDIPLICLGSSLGIKNLAVEIIKQLNVEKLKKHAISVITKDDSSSFKLLLALRALGFVKKLFLDEEVIFFLVQFVDHYSLELRHEAIYSLYKLIKSAGTIDQIEIRKLLAATPHVLRDRLKLIKYDKNLRIVSLKCLTYLWIALDKGKTDTKSSAMFHILVKEQVNSSYIVGSLNVLIVIYKEFLMKSAEERKAAWKCLNSVSPITEFIDDADFSHLMEELIKSLQYREEQKLTLTFINSNNFSPESRNTLLPYLLAVEIEQEMCSAELLCKILIKWNFLHSIKSIIQPPVQISQQLGNQVNKIQLILAALKSVQEAKYLSNWFKGVINQIAENLQWPCKLYPHCNQLLDISADPSFFQNESLPDILPNDYDISLPKVSLDSANSDSEEQGPPISVLFQLVQAGVKSDGLKYWVLWYLKNSLNIDEFQKAAVSWSTLTDHKEFYNPHAENILDRFLQEDADKTCSIIESLNFKSDNFALKLIDALIKGKIKTDKASKALGGCMEMITAVPLEETLKMLWISGTDTSHMMFLNDTVSKVLKNIVVKSDLQLNSLFKALGSTECPLLVQPIWEYIMKMIKNRPGYLLPGYSLSILEFSNVWEAKFLLSHIKILGLVSVEVSSKESGSSMSTKKI